MKVLIVLALTVVSCKAAFLFSSACKTDADCGTNGCCHSQIFGSSCQHRLGYMSLCHLTATSQSSCTTQCGVGFQCVDESKLDLALEPGYNTGTYGRCAHAGTGQPATVSMQPQ